MSENGEATGEVEGSLAFRNVYDEVQKHVPAPFLTAFLAIDTLFGMLDSVDHNIVMFALVLLALIYGIFCKKYFPQFGLGLILVNSGMLLLWCINISEFRVIQLLDYWFLMSTEDATRVIRACTVVLILIILWLSFPDIARRFQEQGTRTGSEGRGRHGK